jgi:hypothetical protein
MWAEKVNMSAQRAIMEQAHPQYHAGVAWGIRSLVAFNDSLLSIRLPESASQELSEQQEGVFTSINR